MDTKKLKNLNEPNYTIIHTLHITASLLNNTFFKI